MPVVEIQGGYPLCGEIRIQGSKNAVLPVMAASLLHKGTVVIRNVPGIQDVMCMLGLLQFLGCVCRLDGGILTVDAAGAQPRPVPEEEGKRMRSSVLLLGPLLARFGEADLGFPGGCSIGKRPVDLHLSALERLGAEVRPADGRIRVCAARLTGQEISLPYPSVGATENALMAACGAEGVTVLRGAAREPEIAALCRFLECMGVRVEGVGTGRIVVRGRSALHSGEFTAPGDRIVAGTYLGALLAAGGEIFLRKAPAEQLAAVAGVCRRMGAKLRADADGLAAARRGPLSAAELSTEPYPGFPTDLQSVFLAAASQARGRTRITENVFEERFATVKELQKLGAHIIISGRTAVVSGDRPLLGGRVRAEDLRGGAALAVAGLAASGRTVVDGYGFIRRGYEDLCGDLAGAGARIRLVSEDAAACPAAGRYFAADRPSGTAEKEMDNEV